MRSLENFKKRVEEREKQERKRGGHSYAYHRYFEGYTEYLTTTPKGKSKICRVYTGAYYRAKISDRQRILQFLTYGACFALAFLLFVYAASAYVISNCVVAVTLMEACLLPFLLWMLLGYINILTGGRELKVGDYKSSSLWIQKASKGGFVIEMAVGVMTAACGLWYRADIAMELSLSLCFFLSALLLLVIRRIESNIEYEQIPGCPDIPEHGIEIT